MKKMLCAAMIACFLFTSCTGSTQYGECIGIADTGKPDLEYKMSIWNALVAAFFFETIIVPVFWAVDYAKCPVAKIEK